MHLFRFNVTIYILFYLWRGKFAIVKYATNKKTGQKFAAKIIKYDSETLKFAIREYDLMVDKIHGKGLVKLHEAFLVRKYLILIMDLWVSYFIFILLISLLTKNLLLSS